MEGDTGGGETFHTRHVLLLVHTRTSAASECGCLKRQLGGVFRVIYHDTEYFVSGGQTVEAYSNLMNHAGITRYECFLSFSLVGL